MKGSPEEDITAANGILRMKSQGHFFEQSWATIAEKDGDIANLIKEDKKGKVTLQDDGWRGMKKCCPIISGGLNPTLLKPFIDVMGHTDFITTMGAGCHAHPRGTRAGATALVQACEAYTKGISIQEYAKKHVELAEAIGFFAKP
jgi:ribulose-bisphosphate carboxylase large chain